MCDIIYNTQASQIENGNSRYPECRHAGVPLSRVGPIAIVMTINLLPVEIARGDVATRAGSDVKLFLTQINRRESG